MTIGVRKHTKNNPPYQVDDSIYKRPDFRKGANPMILGSVGITALTRVQKGQPGFSRLGLSFNEGAWTVANAFGSFSLFGDKGLLSWEPLENVGTHGAPNYAKELGIWDYEKEGWSKDKVTRSVKKVAKVFGASLVGIAKVDQRWFYSKSVYMDMDELLRGVVNEAQMQGKEISIGEEFSNRDLIFQAMKSMENNVLKKFVIRCIELAKPEIRPDGVTPLTAKTIPAAMLHSMLPTVVPTFSVEFLHLLAKELPRELVPESFNPDSILGEDIKVADISETMPAGEIRFADNIDAPIHDRKNMIQTIPNSMKYAVVMAFEMDPDGLTLAHSFDASALVAHGYSRMAFTLASLAQFIRNLGYHAIPMSNDTALSVPMAIDAGLGELSRAGYLITRKYGPRVRLAKLITDMPLDVDAPISFGVTEFCDICGKCAKHCPASAISKEDRSYETPPTGNPGVLKWAIDGAKCLRYWAATGAGCSQCIVACPFNKSEGWIHDVTRFFITARSKTLNKLFLSLDDALGYGKPKSVEEFWKKENYMHINH